MSLQYQSISILWETKAVDLKLDQLLFIFTLKVKVAQLCPSLCDPMDCSPPGSTVHGDSPGKNTGVGCHALLQGIFPTPGLNPGLLYCRQILYCLSHQGSPKILEWVAYSFSRGSSWPRNWTGTSCIAGGFFISWDASEVLLPTVSCLE